VVAIRSASRNRGRTGESAAGLSPQISAYIQGGEQARELRQALANAALRARTTMQVAYEDGVGSRGTLHPGFPGGRNPDEPGQTSEHAPCLGESCGSVGLGVHARVGL